MLCKQLVRFSILTTVVWGTLLVAMAAPAKELNVLFLGDRGPHQPATRFAELQPVMAKRGVKLTYTEEVSQLQLENLRRYDALVLYANIDSIDPRHAAGLLNYVQQGGGFVPLHCATFCFRNSAEMVALMGAQFQRHGTGVFRTQFAKLQHPVLKGFGGFESWDETYVHHLHNEQDRTVLAYRVDAEGREPWTWVRTQGEGRVFYTAWGHDGRTWQNPGFHNLVERGIRWVAKDDPAQVPDFNDGTFPVPEMAARRNDVEPMEFVDVGREIPNYPPSAKWGVQEEPLSKMQQPLPPEESIKHMIVPKGFRVELFAAEPDLGGKPICMAWDDRGRLWVAESYDYPNELQPEGEGRDRIRICEDTDGDGRADKFTLFADKLSIPTSIAFHRGGVVVQNGGQTLYLKDLDGDDVADEREVMFSDWGIGDTHGGVSNFQYGLDNWIWAMQGYNNSRPVVRGEALEHSFRQGFFRFRPDGSELEFLRSTDNNTWGLGISEEGLVFGSTANRNPSVFMPIPNRYYERVSGWTRSLTLGSIADTHLFQPITDHVRQVDHHGGYTAGAGHALYTSREYPREYWNRTAFVNGPTGHLVGTFVLERAGTGYRSTSPFNLLASDDEWTAPIMAEVGPDGQVWVVDWYNFIVQHNPTPKGFETGKGMAYETKLRDKQHGRIYRVVYGDKSAGGAPFSLADASPEKLVASLSHPTMLWRKHAQRLLVERGQDDIAGQLVRLVGDAGVDEVGLNVGAIHALWTLQGLRQLDGRNAEATSAAVAALDHDSAGVRRNAIQVLPRTTESTEALLGRKLLDDEDDQVLLAALLGLADLPPTNSAGRQVFAKATQADLGNDPWLADAIVSAAANNSHSFLPAAAQMKSVPSAELIDVVRIVARHHGRNLAAADAVPLLADLVQAPHVEIINAVIDGLANGRSDKSAGTASQQLDESLDGLFVKVDAAEQGKLIKLARRWGSQRLEERAGEIASALLAKIDDAQQQTAARIEAAQELVRFGSVDDETNVAILDRVVPQTEPKLADGLLHALSASETPALGEQLTSRLTSFTPSQRAATIEVLLGRPGSTRALLAAVDARKVHLTELSLNQRQRLTSHPNADLRRQARQVLERGGSLPNEDRQKVFEELASVAKRTGNAAAGKNVFKKHCAICHVHSGEGSNIGPELTGMAAQSKAELLTHVIDPNRDVEGNYRVYTVLTIDGLTFSGLLASESNTIIELVDVKGEKHQILREDVEELAAAGSSLMPEGFEKAITEQELTDLLEFLTQRGSFRPLEIAAAATSCSVQGMFNDEQAGGERIVFDDWSPKTYKSVPFRLVDPQGGEVKNTILLRGPMGRVSRQMPASVTLSCQGAARAIHMLGGVSGWGFPATQESTCSLIVRVTYDDGQSEDHQLLNGVHLADYNSHVDVPQSESAFKLRNAQIRYLAVYPRRAEGIRQIEFVKGEDQTAPIVMAVTLELP